MRNWESNFIIDLFIKVLTHSESLWLSGRASEGTIRSPEVWFLMETQNFFFVPRLWQDRKYLSLFLYQAQTNHLSYSISIELADQWEHTETMKPLCNGQWIHLKFNKMCWKEKAKEWHSRFYINSKNGLISLVKFHQKF